MANPKRRTSKMRRDKRRSHHGLSVVASSECTNCGALYQPHHVCGSCGWYDGKAAVPVKEA